MKFEFNQEMSTWNNHFLPKQRWPHSSYLTSV